MEINSVSINANIVSAIQNILQSPRLNQLSQEQIERIAKSLLVDRLKQDLNFELEKYLLNDIQLNKYINDWLENYNSTNTRRAFRRALNKFISFNKGNNILDVTPKTIDNFLIHLKRTNLSDNSILQTVHACSSFFSSLIRWKVVKDNPFSGAKLPKKQIEKKGAESVPSNRELDTVEKYARQGMKATGKGSGTRTSGNLKAYVALKMLRNFGFRADAINNLTINLHNKTYETKSKGQIIRGKLTDEIVKLIKKHHLNETQPLKGYNSNAFRVWWRRLFHNPEFRKTVKNRYSPHSVRARFAVDLYKQTKDIYLVSSKLHHSHITITQAYLSSLRSEYERS